MTYDMFAAVKSIEDKFSLITFAKDVAFFSGVCLFVDTLAPSRKNY